MVEATIIRMVLWEASIWAYVAVAVSLGIVSAIEFAERGYRYKRLREGKFAGTYGFYPPKTEEQSK